jgi:hypothetical protein
MGRFLRAYKVNVISQAQISCEHTAEEGAEGIHAYRSIPNHLIGDRLTRNKGRQQ